MTARKREWPGLRSLQLKSDLFVSLIRTWTCSCTWLLPLLTAHCSVLLHTFFSQSCLRYYTIDVRLITIKTLSVCLPDQFIALLCFSLMFLIIIVFLSAESLLIVAGLGAVECRNWWRGRRAKTTKLIVKVYHSYNLCTMHSVLYSVLCTLFSARYSVQCTLCTLSLHLCLCTLYCTIPYILYCVICNLGSPEV